MTVHNGANEHAVNDLSYFEEVEKIDTLQLTVAEVSKTPATHKGEVLVKFSDQLTLLRDVYLVPLLHLDMMSCSKLDERGISTTIVKGNVYSIMLNNKIDTWEPLHWMSMRDCIW